MRVFVTGASGWIGSAVLPELIAAGHQVVGLARTDASAAAVTAAGAEVLRGSLDDLDSLRTGAEHADAVVHLAFKHDFTDYAGAGRTERAAVTTMCDVLEGKAFLFASGVALLTPGRVATELDEHPMRGPDAPRGGAEELASQYTNRGVRTVSLRFAPTVHGAGDHGFIAELVRIARERGVSGFVGDGANRWPAVHRADAAALVRLALDHAPAGAAVHAVAEEGVPAREIAAAIGHGLGVPVAAAPVDDFGWIGRLFAADIPASSALTRKELGWTPTRPTLLEDLAAGHYFI
ncbi:SDR family oxidoreductase [Dactylosporangium aurantiacum]|uniref:SDR family oxidoreductase n=1 Tax=Dactylosporangium aurantiacum TaxID=35754 RepID=A0A9Q9IGC0_9ACTN|nr:SDR family oxidoreductase [Dactylosporangium aurantiacum]MDG6100937.1 SDR family oxidoreductase [Dactylosporangium aurantiacum]UWZ55011.1 SDR family oxidoreductase [Dactylosporangium aurantiacum]